VQQADEQINLMILESLSELSPTIAQLIPYLEIRGQAVVWMDTKCR